MTARDSSFGTGGDHLDAERCLDLLHGLLPQADVDRLLTHASDCERCEAVFRDGLVEFETLRAGPQLVRDVDGRLSLRERVPGAARGGHIRRDSSSRVIPLPSRPVWWVAVAAAAAVAAFLLWPASEPRLVLPEFWITSERELASPRGASRTAHESLQRGLRAYAARDTRAALSHFEAANVEGPLHELRTVYVASTLLNLKRPAQALSALDTIAVEDLPEPWWTEARWIRALAFLEVGREPEATPVLDALARTDTAIGRQARELLDALHSGSPNKTKPPQ